VADDSGVTWAPYTKTRWTSGAAYVAGNIVTDPYKANTLDKGQLYIALTSGTAAGSTGTAGDTGVSWEPYNLTHIEIFKATVSGFDNSACQDAVELLATGGSQGQIKADIDDCMGYVSGGASNFEANSNAALNHAIHTCWYRAKQGVWPPGAGAVNAQMNACADVYGDVKPWALTPDDTAYGCFGVWRGNPATDTGYVGRCWNPGGGYTLQCTKYNKDGSCKTQEWVCTSPPCATSGWDATGAGYGDVDGDGDVDAEDCVDQAMQDYCQDTSIPEVVDPSEQISDMTLDTEGFWNIPAMLTDSGVVGQLDDPLLVMKGLIDKSSAPSGLIQEFAEDIRIGAMVFNHEGSKSECEQTDPFVLYSCTDPNNKDAGKVIAPLDKSSAHTTSLVNAINRIKATSWTPLAEAIYNAIGYYAQRSDMRLNAVDFKIVGMDTGAVDRLPPSARTTTY